MLRSLFRTFRARENGQALVLFAGGLVVFLGLVSMSIDVGRFVWARTQMQSAVDAAALAAAGGMPSTTAATANANQYWTDNSGFIRSQGQNVVFNVTFPGGTNRGVSIHAEADIPTWFAKFFGVGHWHVSADGAAASTVLDVSVVMDISQSMCDDSYPRVDQRPNMSPGSGTVPLLTAAITATQTVLPVSTTAPFTARVDSYFTGGVTGYGSLATWAPPGTTNNGSAPYYVSAPKTSYQGFTFTARPGLIAIGNATSGSAANGELMQVTAVNAAAKTITVIRGVNDKRGSQTNPSYAGVPTVATTHPANAEVWFDRNGRGCTAAAKSSAGPYQPYDSLVTDAQYFTTLFNSTYDKFGVTYFSSPGATIKLSLSSNFGSVTSAMGSMPAPGGGTNTAHGIAVGRQVLDGSGTRANANKVMVLITDGRAKEYCGATYNANNYNTTSCPSPGGGIEGNASAQTAAEMEAQRAVADGIQLYVIGLGAGVDASWLEQIADGGVAGVGPCQNGQPLCRYFGSPTSGDLASAFTSIAEQTHIALTQ